MYRISCDGEFITAPMTLDLIIAAFGPVNKLEKSGFRLIKVA